eukprot:SAG31_NODE_69_length_28130_cov_15.318219_14_plen_260_part_00
MPDSHASSRLAAIEALMREFELNLAYHSTIGTTHNFLHLSAVRHIYCGHSPCDWQRRAGHERKVQLLREGDHLFGPVVSPGEMLIGKNRGGCTNRFEAIGASLEEAIARVHSLVMFVRRVVSVSVDPITVATALSHLEHSSGVLGYHWKERGYTHSPMMSTASTASLSPPQHSASAMSSYSVKPNSAARSRSMPELAWSTSAAVAFVGVARVSRFSSSCDHDVCCICNHHDRNVANTAKTLRLLTHGHDLDHRLMPHAA